MTDRQRKAATADFLIRHPGATGTATGDSAEEPGTGPVAPGGVPDYSPVVSEGGLVAASAPAEPRKLRILDYLGKHSMGLVRASVADTDTVLWGRMRSQGGGSKSGHRLWGSQQSNTGRLFEVEFAQFKQAALDVISVGGIVALEWPSKSQYWNHPNVQSFLKEWDFAISPMKACRLKCEGGPSLTSNSEDGYIRVASNCMALLKSLHGTFGPENKSKVFRRCDLVQQAVELGLCDGESGEPAGEPVAPDQSSKATDFPIKLSAVAMAAVMEQIKEGRVLNSEIPVMPLEPTGSPTVHREKLDDPRLPFNQMVARAVSPKEASTNAEAQKAMKAEIDALRDHGVWDEKKMRERSEVLGGQDQGGESPPRASLPHMP